ncbi:MAG: hypothetical protein IJ106_10190 [Parasporobacterium sp.]|nr:hypothetical protein [Parasporobacterium sp.]
MRLYVPENKVAHAPEWWDSERYDYCDVIMEKEDAGNLFGRIFRKFTQLFA